ncbi:MAG: zinc metallopeptidase [Anaerolineae bacterium]|jgi:Zn-dependent membrane protease YugP|nr:zinc metallopeptidase [Anaerolineae bacterium]MDH7474210.1 zinc metallopeptidase [Anaerolineae bacterium]
MFFFDPLYLLFALPALLLGLYAQIKVQSAMGRYSRVPAGTSGAQAARTLLDANTLYDVQIEESHGFLSDHYDPVKRVLRLSPQVARGNSVASVGVAAHEAGHALQHATGYWPLQIRTGMVPVVQFGSWLGPLIFLLGWLVSGFEPKLGTSLAWAGVLAFAGVAAFAIVTLPVELDASRRAKTMLQRYFMIDQRGMAGVNAVLDAAALTYVAAAVQAIFTLLYYVFLLSGFSRRRR